MSSSELPTSCVVDLASALSDSQSPSSSSFARSHSQPLPSSSQRNTQSSQNVRKRRANVQKINLANIGQGKRGSAQMAGSGAFGGSQDSDSLNAATSISDDDNCDSPLEDANEKRLRLNSQSTYCSSDDGYDQIAELECSQGSASVRSQPISNGATIIGDGAYELVGSGRECKAVHLPTKTIMQCQILKAEEFKTFVLVNERIKRAEAIYHQSEFQQLKELIVPEGTVSIKGESGFWYILMPDHGESLHSYVQNRRQVFTERQAQPLFKQIVELVEFCHRIGIYLRDFKLRKFVFVDETKQKIRLNSVLDLYAAPKMEEDALSDRCVCPAYVAPEILNMNQKTYAAKPADIWGLGVLMFILLTGHYPFFDSNPRAFFRRIKARRFSYPIGESISHPARWLLYSLLRQNPDDRPSATELLHSLWLRTDPESLPDDEKAAARMSSSQPTSSSGSGMATLTTSSSQPSLSTPVMRLMLATTTPVTEPLSARVLAAPDILEGIDQTVPTLLSMPMTAPVISHDSSSEEPNVFMQTIVSNASISDSQAHLASHI